MLSYVNNDFSHIASSNLDLSPDRIVWVEGGGGDFKWNLGE